MDMIIEQAITNKRCKSISLGFNGITSQGASILAKILYHNSTLQELWLSTNHLADTGVLHLTQALSVNKTLKKLGLAANDITNTGVMYLAEMLKKNQTINTLGLAKNKIGDQGVQLLANVLVQQNMTLEVVTLDRNPSVSDLSVNALINMLKQNTKLKELWINDCNLSDKGKKKLQEGLAFNKHVKLVTTYAKSS